MFASFINHSLPTFSCRNELPTGREVINDRMLLLFNRTKPIIMKICSKSQTVKKGVSMILLMKKAKLMTMCQIR